MSDHLLKIFRFELATQCKFIVIGAMQVNAALKTPLAPASSDQVWFGLQGIVISAANASKLLWGSREAPVLEERRALRESVGVTDDSPLSSRKLRNDFEHFDERLVDWFAESANHNYFGRNISQEGGIVVDGKEPEDQFGHFDPSTAVVTFWDNSSSLNEVVAEAERILTIPMPR